MIKRIQNQLTQRNRSQQEAHNQPNAGGSSASPRNATRADRERDTKSAATARLRPAGRSQPRPKAIYIRSELERDALGRIVTQFGETGLASPVAAMRCRSRSPGAENQLFSCWSDTASEGLSSVESLILTNSAPETNLNTPATPVVGNNTPANSGNAKNFLAPGDLLDLHPAAPSLPPLDRYAVAPPAPRPPALERFDPMPSIAAVLEAPCVGVPLRAPRHGLNALPRSNTMGQDRTARWSVPSSVSEDTEGDASVIWMTWDKARAQRPQLFRRDDAENAPGSNG